MTNKSNRILTILTLAMLALAITGTASGNEMTFILGTGDNSASLLNASGNVAVDINIYNATQAMSMDFANESVLFLASLDDETVSWINSTIDPNTDVIAYNLPTNVSIGNVDDANITKYWVYGGDENIGNLITYLDNKFYGNTITVDMPKPPENRAKIAILTGPMSVNYVAFIDNAKDDPHISKHINVTSHFVYNEDLTLYHNLDLSDQDVIIAIHLGFLTVNEIKETIRAARDGGGHVILHAGSYDVYNLSNVNTSDPAYSNITEYCNHGKEENMKWLITFLGVTFCNVSMEILPPVPTPLWVSGILSCSDQRL